MPEERRGDRRSPISAVRITYEGASGAQVEADVVDLTAGGMFIRTEAPLTTGKRIALDLHIVGEPGPWSALGRVVWARPSAEADRPAGMGVKLIDVDDATVAAIERLVETREPTAHGLGAAPAVAPAPVVVAYAPRDRTLMGVGFGSEPRVPLKPLPTVFVEAAAPVEAPAQAPAPPHVEPPVRPPHESIAEMAAHLQAAVVESALPALELPPPPSPSEPIEPTPPPADQSLAIDLVATKRVRSSFPPPRASRPPVASIPPPGVQSARWLVAALMFVVAGIAAYVLFDGFLRPMGR